MPCAGAGWRAPSSATRNRKRRARRPCGWASSPRPMPAPQRRCAAPISSSCARRSGPAVPIAEQIGASLAPGAILTDVGSVKGAIVRDVGPFVPKGVHFIPGHPIAGTEHSGPEAGFAELFDGRWCVLTPPADADAAAVEKLSAVLAGVRLARRGDERRAPRHGAGHHQPRAASDRLQHRQHGPAPGARHRHRGDQVLGRRLPRFHAHRRLRSGDVARRLPQQQGGGAGDAGPLQRGSDRPAARHPLRRRRHALQAVRGGACGPSRHHPGRPGHRRSRLRPAARHRCDGSLAADKKPSGS